MVGLTALGLAAGCSKAARMDYGREADAAADNQAIPSESYDAIVTVKRSPTDTLYFQLDDNTRLFPANYQKQARALQMQRVICHLTEYLYLDSPYGNYATVDWTDPLEKGTFSASASATISDGLDILNDWMTSVEDGFLTLHYRTWWGSGSVRHRLSLHSGVNPEDPYELCLVHDVCGDEALEQADALIYFDINSLPHTEGQYKTLTLKWTSGEGTLTARQFRFRSRE
jgi:hypothetical protein